MDPGAGHAGRALRVNLIAVKVFGEFEFWFAIIKVVTIIAMIVIGLVVILFGVGELGQTASFANLVGARRVVPDRDPGRGPDPADRDVRLPGRRAGRRYRRRGRKSRRTLPHAINSIVWRILIFYIGALIVIMSVVPWNQFDPGVSPFVMVFERIGIPAAAGIINFVVITAAASSCNSGIFSTGRMLYTLAQFGQAPARLRQGQCAPCPGRRRSPSRRR